MTFSRSTHLHGLMGFSLAKPLDYFESRVLRRLRRPPFPVCNFCGAATGPFGPAFAASPQHTEALLVVTSLKGETGVARSPPLLLCAPVASAHRGPTGGDQSEGRDRCCTIPPLAALWRRCLLFLRELPHVFLLRVFKSPDYLALDFASGVRIGAAPYRRHALAAEAGHVPFSFLPPLFPPCFQGFLRLCDFCHVRGARITPSFLYMRSATVLRAALSGLASPGGWCRLPFFRRHPAWAYRPIYAGLFRVLLCVCSS